MWHLILQGGLFAALNFSWQIQHSHLLRASVQQRGNGIHCIFVRRMLSCLQNGVDSSFGRRVAMWQRAFDRYAVAAKKPGAGLIVGHLPKKISRRCSVFILRGGTIRATVTGRRRYSSDLAQGGLEIPCKLKFSGEPKEIQKVRRAWHHRNHIRQL